MKTPWIAVLAFALLQPAAGIAQSASHAASPRLARDLVFEELSLAQSRRQGGRSTIRENASNSSRPVDCIGLPVPTPEA